jgi:hypothetical protein
MPATRELIHEKISEIEGKIQELESRGEDASSLKATLVELTKSFRTSGVALNENSNLLKG